MAALPFPYRYNVGLVYPQASWVGASCSREAHVVGELGVYDGPLLAEEAADMVARAQIQDGEEEAP